MRNCWRTWRRRTACARLIPGCKLAAGLSALVLCLLSTGYASPLFIALVLSAAVLLLARVDIRTYTELFLVPLWFAVMSAIVIVLISGGDQIFWSCDPLPFLSLSVSRGSINIGFFILCRVIGSMSALLFIALTTPMTDLFVVMRKCRIPDFVIDLAMIIYRTIFFLMDQVQQIYRSQVMRLGILRLARVDPEPLYAMRGGLYHQLGCGGRPDPGHGRPLL